MATLSAVDIEDAGVANNMVFGNDTSVIVARPGELTKIWYSLFKSLQIIMILILPHTYRPQAGEVAAQYSGSPSPMDSMPS